MTQLLTSKDCLAKYGDPEDEIYMILWDIPKDVNAAIPELPNRLYCCEDLTKPLERALRNVIDRGKTIEVYSWDGCFNIRRKRGSQSPSLHSWGVAVDINAGYNQFGKTPTMSPGLVMCFTDAGFDWGGVWGKPDGMHFQLKREVVVE